MQTYNFPLFQSAVVLNANITGQAFPLKQMYGYSIQIVVTGTPTGTFKLQASSDPASGIPLSQTVSAPTNWTDITNSPYTITAAGNFTWNVYDVMYNYVRLIYTDASGGTSTATLNATFNGKGI